MSTIATFPASARRSITPILRIVQQVEEWANFLAPTAALAIVLLFAAWAWFGSRAIRLQFDELLEISAANAPTTSQVLSFLASGVDFNPPLSHYAIRASTFLFGNTELAARLPAFIGMVVLLVSLYILVSHQYTRVLGIVAMLFIVCLPVRNYAIQARPYGFVLGFSGLTVLLYRYAANQRHRVPALISLAICAGGLVASHYYAVLVVGILLAAEMVRSYLSKRMDWAMLLCCAGPPMVVLFLLRDAIVQQRHQLTHYFARGNLLSFDHGYDSFAIDPLIYCVALILILCALYFRAEQPETTSYAIRRNLTPTEFVLAIGLLLLPIVGAIFTQLVTHAYVTRYFLPTAIGIVICLCYVANVFSRIVPGLSLILILSLGLGFGKAMLQEVLRPPETLPAISQLTANDMPLLFDTPANYAQIYYYYPTLRRKSWVIIDPAASLHYRQYDTDDRIMQALAEHNSAQTISLSAAIRRWQKFRLVPRSADYLWALKCVIDAGAKIEVVGPFGKSNFIFDVTVTSNQYSQIDACAQVPLFPSLARDGK